MKIREIPQQAIEFIKRWEGLELMPYQDIAGYWTIGIGHLIRKGEDFSEGITEEQAEDIFRQDSRSSVISIMRLVSVPLSDNQFSALLSFAFNLGGGALQRSTLRSRLNRGEYERAAEELPKWCYAGGKKVRGLYLRRMEEKNLFLTEEDNENGKEE